MPLSMWSSPGFAVALVVPHLVCACVLCLLLFLYVVPQLVCAVHVGCASLTAERRVQSTVTREFLDVALDGFVFRLVLFYPRQLMLLEVRAAGPNNPCNVCVWLRVAACL